MAVRAEFVRYWQQVLPKGASGRVLHRPSMRQGAAVRTVGGGTRERPRGRQPGGASVALEGAVVKLQIVEAAQHDGGRKAGGAPVGLRCWDQPRLAGWQGPPPIKLPAQPEQQAQAAGSSTAPTCQAGRASHCCSRQQAAWLPATHAGLFHDQSICITRLARPFHQSRSLKKRERALQGSQEGGRQAGTWGGLGSAGARMGGGWWGPREECTLSTQVRLPRRGQAGRQAGADRPQQQQQVRRRVPTGVAAQPAAAAGSWPRSPALAGLHADLLSA